VCRWAYLLLWLVFLPCTVPGQEWQFLGPQPLMTPQGMRAGAILATVTAPSGALYAGGHGSLWRSADGGASWRVLPFGLGARSALALGIGLNGALWVGLDAAQSADTSGLWMSSDGGVTFSVRGFPGLDVTQFVTLPDGTLLVCARGPGTSDTPPGLYASHDAGVSWTLLLPDPVSNVVAMAGVMLATHGGRVLRSTDGGATFALAIGAVGAADAVLAAGRQDAFVLFLDAGNLPVALLHSPDAGQTWVPATLPGTPAWPTRPLLAVDPTRPTHLWMGGADLWFSPDAGVSWSNRTTTAVATAVSPNQHVMAWDAVGGFWLGNDGGLWRSLDGLTFQNQNATLANLDVDELAADASGGARFVALGGQGIARPDAAQGWTLVAGGNGGSLLQLPSGVLVVVDRFAAALRRSVDGGVSFQTLTGADTPAVDHRRSSALVPLIADAGSALYCATWRVWQSPDAGLTWHALAGSELTGTATALAPGPGGVVWEGADSGQVLRSDDAGLTWRDVTGPWPRTAVAAVLATAGQLTVALSGPGAARLWTSLDGGVSWSSSVAALPPVRQLLGDPVDAAVLYAATAAGVMASPDGGRHWLPLGHQLLHTDVTALLLTAGSRRLWAASVGRGAWSFPLNASSAQAQPLQGAGQSAPVTTALPQPLVVHVANAFGADLAGATVTWNDGGAGGVFSAASSTTAADGTAAATYTLPARAGPLTVTATVAGTPSPSVATFAVTALPGAATQMTSFGGSNQTQIVGTRLADPLRAKVVDALGNGVADITVSFDDHQAGGRFDTPAVATDSHGIAQVAYVLPAQPGPVTITAASANLASVSFTETATPLPDFSVALVPSTLSLNQGVAATLSLTTAAVGGSTQAAALLCQQPATGCTVTPASVIPGGTATVSVAAGALPVGTSLLTVTAGDGTHTHSASATVTVLARDYALTVTPATQAVAAGSKATFALTATPAGGLSGTLALACGPLPATVSCAFSNAAPALDGVNAVSSTLTVSTAAATTGMLFGPGPASGTAERTLRGVAGSSYLALGWAALFFLAGTLRSPKRRVALLCCALALLPACGGGAIAVPARSVIPGTPAGNYTITVTATGAGLPAHTLTVALTVQ